MATRIVGYAPSFTVSGNSVSWAAGKFDLPTFAAFTTSDYIANVTVAGTSQITSNDGVQGDGSYKITVASTSGWSTGNLGVPQVGASIAQYNTLALAWAAAADGDLFQICYSNTAGRKLWGEYINSGAATTTCISMTGMVPGITFGRNTQFWYCAQGNLAGQTNRLELTNLIFYSIANGSVPFQYGDSSASGKGFLLDRCKIVGATYGIFVNGTKNNVSEIRSSLFMNCDYGVVTAIGIIAVNNVTAARCVTAGFHFNNVACVVKNCYGLDCVVAAYINKNNCTGSNNASADGTAPGTAPTTLTRANALLACDTDYGFSADFRPTKASPLQGAGVAVTGVDYDLDGQAIGNPPPIGCSIGKEMVADYPSEDDVRLDVDYDYSAKTGNCRVPTASHVELDYDYDSNDSVKGTLMFSGSNWTEFTITNPDNLREVSYRVVGIGRIPGTGKKRLRILKIDKPLAHGE